MASNSIVQLNISQTVAPTPPTLQQSGAIVSQGATSLAVGNSYLLTQLSDLASILKGALPLASLSWAGGTVTATSSGTLGFNVGDYIELTISGVTPAAYNGTFSCFVSGATTFTYVVPSNPGAASIMGIYTPEDVAELQASANTFFAQGNQVAVSVLELGPGDADDGVATLTNYLVQYPNSNYTSGSKGYFYIYLVPRYWDGNAAFLALIAQYQALTARTYFYVTTTLSTYALYTALMKDVVALVESPTTAIYPSNLLTSASWSSGVVTANTTSAHNVVPGDWFQLQGNVPNAYNGYWLAQAGTTGNTLVFNLSANPGINTTLGTLIASLVSNTGVPVAEFSIAAAMWVILNQRPSQTNKVTPYAFSYLFGVTAFPQQGNQSLIAALKAAAINYIGTGAEGGISDACLFWGTTMDTRDFTYWYAVDWMSINGDMDLAAAIIDGSNDPINPLYYDQNGINRLQDKLFGTATKAVAVGLGNGKVVRTTLKTPDLQLALDAGTYAGQIVVNAVPFTDYLAVNPGDYKIGEYDGLSVSFIPNRGFIHIIVNMNVTDFIAP